MRKAASTQDCVDSRSPQVTRSCVSPLRRKKRAPPPERSPRSSSSSSSRIADPCRRSLSRSHSSRLSRQPPRSRSSRSREAPWPHAEVPTKASPTANIRAFCISISSRISQRSARRYFPADMPTSRHGKPCGEQAPGLLVPEAGSKTFSSKNDACGIVSTTIVVASV